MSDGMRGTIIAAAGYCICILIVLLREKRRGRSLRRPGNILFVIWMILCIIFIAYRFLA